MRPVVLYGHRRRFDNSFLRNLDRLNLMVGPVFHLWGTPADLPPCGLCTVWVVSAAAEKSLNSSAEPLLSSLGILVDYDNCDELRGAEEAGPWQYFLTQTIHTAMETAARTPERIVIRLYGGWNQG